MNEQEIKELEKMTTFLKDAEVHPLIQQIIADKQAATLAKRMAATDRILTIEAERNEALPRLIANRDKAELAYKRARATMESAADGFNAALAALSSENTNFETSIGRLQQTLIESSDPAIDLAIQFFRDKLNWLRSPGRISHGMTGSETNPFTETVTLHGESNRAAVLGTLEYCQDAIKRLESMKLIPAIDLERIEAIKQAIPDINVYSENTGEKPMPGSKGIPFASQFKSDSQHDWEMSNLLEKAGKILSAPKRA